MVRWLRETLRSARAPNDPEPTSPPAESPARPGAPVVRCPRCHSENRTLSWARLVDATLSARRLECAQCGADIGAISVIDSPVDVEWMIRKLDEGPIDRPAPGNDAALPDVLGLRSWGERYLVPTLERGSPART